MDFQDNMLSINIKEEEEGEMQAGLETSNVKAENDLPVQEHEPCTSTLYLGADTIPFTERAMIENNIIDSNIVEGNIIEGNMIGGNTIEGNMTTSNMIANNIIEGNMIEDNLIESNMIVNNFIQTEDLVQNIETNTVLNEILNPNEEVEPKTVREISITLDIKTEDMEDPFQNVQLLVKQEDSVNMGVEGITKDLTNTQAEKTNSNETVSEVENCLDIRVKEETNDELVTYDYPDFDGNSMDSDDAAALGNVEACLQDDMQIKSEVENSFQEPEKEDLASEIKMESDMTVTDTMLTPQLTNNVTENTQEYEFLIKIPNAIVNNLNHHECMENKSHNSFANDLCQGEQCNHTDGNSDCDYQHLAKTMEKPIESDEVFQLNSITGNYLSLEQEARRMTGHGFSCKKCPKYCVNKKGFEYHLNVHQTIENYHNGRLRAKETRKKNQARQLREMRSHRSETKSPKCSERKEESKYACTCGKFFKRRSRMETCLRSHDYFESKNKYVSCMTCLKKFKNKKELSEHRQRTHRKRFSCKFCPTDYDTRKELFKHLQIHQKVQLMEYKVIEEVVKGKQELKCFMCSKMCTDLSELKTHVMLEHTGPFCCPHCKNSFPKIIDFGNHTKTYHPEVEGQSVLDVLEAFSRLVQEWKCEECHLQFLEPDKLALHQIEKHSPELKAEPQFQCEDCRRVFISQKGLTSHRRIHHSIETVTETKPEELGIMCLECRTICKDINALTSHMRFHSPDRKYPCKFCDFRFATPEKRKAHLDIHTGDMKFVCFICEYQCSSENRLKQHKLSLKHANMKEYLLTGKPLIEESTSKDKGKEKKEGSAKKRKKVEENNESERDSGSSSSDTEDVACDICGENFSTEEKMLEHKQTHPFIEFPNDDKPSRIFFK